MPRIENCLKALHHAIGNNGQAQRLIQTRYGQGYGFVAPVTLSPMAQRAKRLRR